jgi:hypothetical protein
LVDVHERYPFDEGGEDRVKLRRCRRVQLRQIFHLYRLIWVLIVVFEGHSDLLVVLLLVLLVRESRLL